MFASGIGQEWDFCLAVGTKFKFETQQGRKGTAEVMKVDPESDRPYHCKWWDASGKHYEWFSFNEFKTLEVV